MFAKNLMTKFASTTLRSASLQHPSLALFSSINAVALKPPRRQNLAEQNGAQQLRKFQTSACCAKKLPGFQRVDPPKVPTVEEVEERVLKAIKAWDRFPQDRAEKLTLDARFVEDLGFDSLDQVEIVMSLEDEFGMEIKQEDTEQFKTPRDVATFLVDYIGIGDDEF